jgi:hypothetical protein
MSIHCHTFEDALKNASIVLVTLYFEDMFQGVTKYGSISYIGAS